MTAADSGGRSQPEVVLLYCRQALAPAAPPPQGQRAGDGFTARLVMLPCSSKLELPHLLDILAQGADAVLVVACPEKTCRFLVGNRRAEKRLGRGRDLLAQVGMPAERLALVRGSGLDFEKLMGLAAGRADAVRALGPNPMKGDKRP